MDSSGQKLCLCACLLVGCTLPRGETLSNSSYREHAMGSEALLSSGHLDKYLTCYLTCAGSRQGLLLSLSQP